MNNRELENTYLVDVYPKRDVVFVSGHGAVLVDEDGREYIDCAANVGVSALGYGNQTVASAVHDQYLKLPNVYGIFYNDVRGQFAQRLVSLAPDGLSRVFLSNSGTEAIEAAIKAARATTGRSGIVSMMQGFHGKTLGSLAATFGPRNQKPFGPMPAGFSYVPLNNIEKLRRAVSKETAGVIVEIIQGEGGVRPADAEFLAIARQLCDEHGALLIIDEVQTGFGRTGQLFACDGLLKPDILCLAKAIAGGVPMGATLMRDGVGFPKGSHTNTFGGNPLACAAALASLSEIEKLKLIETAAKLGDYFISELKKIDSPKIKEVRGRGLMIGIELTEKAGPYVKQLLDDGVVVLMAGSFVIRLLPPLVIKESQIASVVSSISKVLT